MPVFLSARVRTRSLSFYFCRPHTIFWEKRCIHGFLSHQFFGGVALFLCSDQFRRCNFKCKYRMGGVPHARPTVIEIDCESEKIQIYRVIIFRSTLSKNCKCFHRTDKIAVHSRAPGYFYSAHPLSFLIDIVKSNAIFISFVPLSLLFARARPRCARQYNYGLVKF